MTRPRLQSALRALFGAGVVLTLAIAPTQWALELRPKFFLSPADLSLAFTAGVWLLDLLLSREWRRLVPPPWPSLLFVGLAAASACVAPYKALALKDLVQYVEYFVVGHMLFASYLSSGPHACRNALLALGASTLVTLAAAGLQYASPSLDALHVRGTFGNRNVLGGFLALALPFAFALALAGRLSLPSRAGLLLLVLAGLSLNLSGAAQLAVVAVCTALAAARGAKWFVPTVACLVAWQAFVLPRLPRENDLVHFQSLALYDGSGQAERRYPDWQAAYSMALTHPWLGVGLGNYQKHVGQYYDNVPRQTGPSEPDIQNLYLVLAASAGLPALLALLALLANAVRAAASAPPAAASLQAAATRAAAASLLAFAATSVWHPLLVRGIGLPLVFALTLAYHTFPNKDPHGS